MRHTHTAISSGVPAPNSHNHGSNASSQNVLRPPFLFASYHDHLTSNRRSSTSNRSRWQSFCMPSAHSRLGESSPNQSRDASTFSNVLIDTVVQANDQRPGASPLQSPHFQFILQKPHKRSAHPLPFLRLLKHFATVAKMLLLSDCGDTPHLTQSFSKSCIWLLIEAASRLSRQQKNQLARASGLSAKWVNRSSRCSQLAVATAKLNSLPFRLRGLRLYSNEHVASNSVQQGRPEVPLLRCAPCNSSRWRPNANQPNTIGEPLGHSTVQGVIMLCLCALSLSTGCCLNLLLVFPWMSNGTRQITGCLTSFRKSFIDARAAFEFCKMQCGNQRCDNNFAMQYAPPRHTPQHPLAHRATFRGLELQGQ